jgi:hypothetical protein
VDWGFLFAAATNAVTFALLFQPWLSASGSGGQVRSDAFGRVTGVTNGFDEWSVSKFREMNISGAWGLLAAAAAVVTVFAAVAQVRSRSRALAALVMGSSVAVTVLVLICLLYLDAKGPELRTLIDPGEGFGSGWLRRIFDEDGTAVSGAGEQRMAGAGLTSVALLAGVLSSAAAVAAVAQGARRYGLSTMRALSWLVTPLPTETTPPPAAAEAPRTAVQPTPDAAERVLWDELVFDDDLIANVTWVRNTSTSGSETSAHRSAPVLTR